VQYSTSIDTIKKEELKKIGRRKRKEKKKEDAEDRMHSVFICDKEHPKINQAKTICFMPNRHSQTNGETL